MLLILSLRWRTQDTLPAQAGNRKWNQLQLSRTRKKNGWIGTLTIEADEDVYRLKTSKYIPLNLLYALCFSQNSYFVYLSRKNTLLWDLVLLLVVVARNIDHISTHREPNKKREIFG